MTIYGWTLYLLLTSAFVVTWFPQMVGSGVSFMVMFGIAFFLVTAVLHK